ncbi:hypothetical protein BDR07DRAFT_1376711 [Suillus spraguei]|nr:hypothetical protein BDR07DRAFT_1376711 [Suillus spraguei]
MSSEIAAHKWNTQKNAQASQKSAGEKAGNTDEIWNEMIANTWKCAPIVTAPELVLAAKLACKTPVEKLDHDGHHSEKPCKPKSVTVSIEENDTVSEYGNSDHDSEKSDDNMEVPEDDDLDLVLSQEELIKEIPHFVSPHAARSASAQSQTSSNVSKLSASSSVFDNVIGNESESEMQFADKDSQGSMTQPQCSKTCYHKPTVVKKKQSKLRPRFTELKDEALPANATHDAASKIDDKDLSDYSFTWPVFTDLVYSADGSINLKAQNTWIQTVLKTAVLELKKASIFDNAFPNITQKHKMALEAVHNTARKHKEYAILRVKHDFDYAVALASVPEGWLSSFHTNLKKLAHQIIVSCFALKKGCADEVEDLIKGHKYIFPTDAKGKVLGDQPFCDESITDIIQLSFFYGKNSIGVQSCNDFVSVLDENDEAELPVAMVYVILKDWSSSNLPSSAQVKSFNSSFHISVYKAHQATLTHIFDGIQRSIIAVESSLPTSSLDTCIFLDLDAMGED